MCTKEGLLGCYVPREQFQLLQGENDLILYQQSIDRQFGASNGAPSRCSQRLLS
jgi:hypothetical protein